MRGVALLALACAAQSPTGPSAPPAVVPAAPPEPVPESAPDLAPATLVFVPREDRMTVAVTIAAQPGFRFVVDTGAERSVLAREVAARLALTPGRPVRLVTMGGTTRAATVRVPLLSAGPLELRALEAPVLDAADLDADGMLGLDMLQQRALAIDFTRRTMTVRAASQRPPPLARDENEVVVTARSRFGQLVVTDAYYRGQRVRVVIDTGSAVSMGNAALRQLVTRRQDVKPIRMQDVAGNWIEADYTQIAAVSVGEVTFQNLPVAFAEVQPFRTFRLTEQPAILLGMDALALFRRVDIDFANRRIRFVRGRD